VPTPYTVYHPLGAESLIEGGVGVSAKQQRKALEAADIAYTESPTSPYDIVHLNFLGPTALRALWRARRSEIPVVVHAHSLGDNVAGTYRFSNIAAPALRRFYGFVYRSADAVVAVSENTRDRLRDLNVDGPIHVVSNGVDSESLDGVEDLDGVGPDGPTVVNLAQVYEIKGVETFVEVGRRVSEVQFRWWGHRHPLLAPRSTKRLVQNAPSNVTFPGFIEDKREAFAMADVFLAPSHLETQGMSVLEAAYCGVPIVVRDIPVFEYLTHGKNCLKGETTEELVTAVRRLLDEPSLRTELSTAAQQWAANHTLERVGRDLQAVYEETLETPRSKPP
jgi:1,2-diacylglycerol-3-alpha-glucose alpha-1,2-glucosyltransferase